MNYLLEKGEVLTLITAPAMEAVTVVSGRIWLTRRDDAADYCLGAGDRLPVSAAGTILIEALDDAAVSLVWQEAPSAVRGSVVNVRRCVAHAS